MEQIYDSRHSGQEVDNAVDAVQTTIPNQLTQIGLKLDEVAEDVAGINNIDISKKYPTGGTNGGNTYTLATALAKIPSSDKVIGLAVSFISNDDGLYHTFMYNGQGSYSNVNSYKEIGRRKEEELGFRMDGVVTRGYNFEVRRGYISSTGVYSGNSGYFIQIPLNGGEEIHISANSAHGCTYGLFKECVDDSTQFNANIQFATGLSSTLIVSAGTAITVIAPSDAAYLYIYALDSTYLPSELFIDGYDVAQSVVNNFKVINGIGVNKISITSPIVFSSYDLYQYGITPDGGYIASNNTVTTGYIRVKEGMVVNIAMSFSGDASITPMFRIVAFDAIRFTKCKAIVNTYASVSSFHVPIGYNYVRIAVTTNSSTVRAKDVYEDGDLSLTFENFEIVEDFADKKDIIENGGLPDREITIGDFVHGAINNGVATPNYNVLHVYTPKYYKLKGDRVIFRCKERSDGYHNLIQLNLYDKNFNYLTASNIDAYNYDYIVTNPSAVYVRLGMRQRSASRYNVYQRVSYLAPCEIITNLGESVDEESHNILYFNNDKEYRPRIQQLAKLKVGKQTVRELVLGWFTDIHGGKDNTERILCWCDYYKDYIDDVIHTGDAISTFWTSSFTEFDWWQEAGAEKVLNVIGNHDMLLGNYTSFASKAMVYEKIFAPYVSNWGIIQPTDAATNYLMYYYKDYPSANVRLIVLDDMNMDDDQMEWLVSILESARTSGYAVLIAQHYPAGSLSASDCAFNSDGYQTDGTAAPSAARLAVDNFIDGGGEFVAWVCGHTHSDGCGFVAENPRQFCIVGDTALARTNGLDNASSDAFGYKTKAYDCFNVIAVDQVNKLFNVMRVGRDVDNHMRHIGYMCYNYSTRRIERSW